MITSQPIVDLPQSIYDQILDPAVTSLKMPQGRYNLPVYFNGVSHGSFPTGQFIEKSNFDLDFNGSTIYLNEPRQGAGFFFRSVLDFFDALPDSTRRHCSHLTGTINPGTTQLTMDVDETVAVQPGEIVTILAGCNPSDPVEPYQNFVNEVLSVVGQVITFVTPFPEAIPTYADEDDFKTHVSPGLWSKIGPWGFDAAGGNWHKGFLGTDHGLQRYVGGMQHDITMRNGLFIIRIPPDNLIPTQDGTAIEVNIAQRFNLINMDVLNFVHSVIHTTQVEDLLVSKLRVGGRGRMIIFGQPLTHNGRVFTTYGGNNLNYDDVTIIGENMALADTEVSPRNTRFRRLHYDVHFNPDWKLEANATVFLFTPLSLGYLRIEDPYCKTTGDGWAWGGNFVTYKNLEIDLPWFKEQWTFRDPNLIEGTLKVGGVTYGPLVTTTHQVVRSAVPSKPVHCPKGFFRFMRWRCLSIGACDGMSGSLLADLQSGVWITAIDNFTEIKRNVLPADHFANEHTFTFHFTPGDGSGQPITLEFDYQFYPAEDDPGWIVEV